MKFHPVASCLLLACILSTPVAAVPVARDSAGSILQEPPAIPYGPGSSWIVGHELYAAGDLDEALPFLHMAYRHAPDVVPVAREFAAALQARGYFEDALEVMDDLVAAHPDSLAFRYDRARLLVQLGRSDDALRDLAWLRGRRGVTDDMVSLEASLLSAQGRVDDAMAVLREGLDLFPDRAPAIYLGMATVLERNDRVQDAPAVLREGLARFPGDKGLTLALMEALVRSGRHEEALAAAARADSLFGLPAPAVTDSLEAEDAGTGAEESFRIELADLYFRNGDSSRGLVILEAMDRAGELALQPSLYLARSLLHTGDKENGRKLLDRILHRWPGSGRAWFLAGRLAEDGGDLPGALENYDRAVALAPRDPELRLALVRGLLLAMDEGGDMAPPDSLLESFPRHVKAASAMVPPADHMGQMVLGYAFRRLDDSERAGSHFLLAAEDSSLRFNALIQASLSLDRAGDVRRARQTLETLRRENPDNAEIANSLGYFLAEKNLELDEAERLVAQALETDPGNGAYLDSMGWVRYRQGRLAEAFDYLIRAVNVLPDDPVILEHLGIVLRDQGQAAEAADMFRRAKGLGGDAIRLEELLREVTGPGHE